MALVGLLTCSTDRKSLFKPNEYIGNAGWRVEYQQPELSLLADDSLATAIDAREELKVCCDVLLKNQNRHGNVEERAGYTDRTQLLISH